VTAWRARLRVRYAVNYLASPPEGSDSGANYETRGSDQPCLLPTCESKKTAEAIWGCLAWTIGSCADACSYASADSGANECVAEAMLVFHQTDDADVLLLNGLLDQIDLDHNQDILITPCVMEGRPGFWILPVFKGTWNPNPAGHFPNQIIEISLVEEFPNIARGLTVSLEIPGTSVRLGC
jgi:hypothetical protein